jgi:hypothetical protein
VAIKNENVLDLYDRDGQRFLKGAFSSNVLKNVLKIPDFPDFPDFRG